MKWEKIFSNHIAHNGLAPCLLLGSPDAKSPFIGKDPDAEKN